MAKDHKIVISTSTEIEASQDEMNQFLDEQCRNLLLSWYASNQLTALTTASNAVLKKVAQDNGLTLVIFTDLAKAGRSEAAAAAIVNRYKHTRMAQKPRK